MRTAKLWPFSSGLGALAFPIVAACAPQDVGSTRPAPAIDVPVQRGPVVTISYAESSRPLRELVLDPAIRHVADEANEGHPARPIRSIPVRVPAPMGEADPVLQRHAPLVTMPASGVGFVGQGKTNSASTMGGTPPDTNGAVGPKHFVQTVNTGLAIWDKSGNVVLASEAINTLWSGYQGTHSGNGCADNNDGDPVVLYDQLADRWFITEFSLPGPPDFQCVAVSKTGDPTGAYWLYDFQYPGMNDYGKFGVWPDAYYANYNMFGSGGGASDFCAFDRASMLTGAPAQQQCFQQGSNVSGALPASVDGAIPPPRGTPGFFMQISDNQSLDLFQFHVDWKDPSKSAVTGPTNIQVSSFNPLCGGGGGCVPQLSGGGLDTLSDRLMFRLAYRNFGAFESLTVNHSVDASNAGGVRWYEIRSPMASPVVHQQGTYAPADGNWRWMGSLAMDQAEDFALGFSISSSSTNPGVAWTGRLAGDSTGTMGQGETVLVTGNAGESGMSRWGDYSAMTVDPTDDCTFWYTQELYNVSGTRSWDTFVASVKFPRCAANDFTIGASPSPLTVNPGGQAKCTVSTGAKIGTPESVALFVQDLPDGVTGAFSPTSVTAGGSATLTLTAAKSASLTLSPVTFTVIGKAASAAHPATAQVAVSTCVPLATCPSPENCGTIADGCGGNISCGTCVGADTCVANQCVSHDVDAGAEAGGGVGADAGAGVDAGSSGSGAGDNPGARWPDDSGGCGCGTAQTGRTSWWALLAIGALAARVASRRRAWL